MQGQWLGMVYRATFAVHIPKYPMVHYIPIVTCTLSVVFTIILYKHWRRKPSNVYLFWWMLGVATYGAGTLTESINTLYGWNEANFKAWYIFGALLGGAPLAQGSVYLLTNKRVGHILSTLLVSVVLFASTCVILSPVDHSLVTERLTGKVLEWHWVRLISPFINTYAVIFLVGGAIYSAIKYSRQKDGYARMMGNIWIAVGTILPGIGGTFTRFGHVEVLYVTELIGLCCVIMGYYTIKNDKSHSVHQMQAVA